MANPKDLPRDIGGFIRDLRRNARISLRQLAEQAGVSNPYLSQIERGLRKPSAEVLQQIASALRVSTPAMYLRAGLLDDREGQGVIAAITADPDLTMAQKQSLIQIYETFRRENARHQAETGSGPAGTEDAENSPVAGIRPPSAGKTAGPDLAEAVLDSVAVTEAGAAGPPTAAHPATEPAASEPEVAPEPEAAAEPGAAATEPEVAAATEPVKKPKPVKKIAKRTIRKTAPAVEEEK
ncbi:helix-turn-helix domain-containing protein [Micromonospora sp. NPDC049559]|uniref:helix-turn-helix domain-containing protein n=1 Tax=Micromonospora sp. NPDC049559 TaxID=3155923 RepID=UPI003433AC31